MRDQHWIRSPGLILRRDARARLEKWGLTSVEGADAFNDGEIHRRIAEKSLVCFERDQRRYFLKRYHFNRLSVNLRGLLKANFPVFSGPIEWANLQALEGAGFRVPRPLAAGIGGSLTRGLSFILLEQLPGRPLSEALQGDAFSEAEKNTLAATLGELVRRFHAAGFCHRDLYLCHIFIHETLGLGLLDCERVRRWQGPPQRWIVKDLAALLYSARGLLSEASITTLLSHYQTSEELFARVQAKVLSIARRGSKG